MKILYISTLGITMNFFISHIKMLLKEGHEVELACNDTISPVNEIYRKLGVKVHDVPFSRSVISAENLKGVKELSKLIKAGKYDVVHTHTPNASAIARFVCRKYRKQGLKVVYTAHGFHFYTGAPKLNWMLFYPVEWVCAYWTDVLITINKEDYERAKKHMHAKTVEYVQGVGVNLEKFELPHGKTTEHGKRICEELGISETDFVLVYVAEMNKNKNQISLLHMIKELGDTFSNIKLLLVGGGVYENYLKEQSKELGIEQKVIFLGFRNDIPQILSVSDVAVPSSIREGLGINIVEAMASGVPVVAYDNRGHRSVIKHGNDGFIVSNGDYKAMASYITDLMQNKKLYEQIVSAGRKRAEQFSEDNVVAVLQKIYERISGERN